MAATRLTACPPMDEAVGTKLAQLHDLGRGIYDEKVNSYNLPAQAFESPGKEMLILIAARSTDGIPQSVRALFRPKMFANLRRGMAFIDLSEIEDSCVVSETNVEVSFDEAKKNSSITPYIDVASVTDSYDDAPDISMCTQRREKQDHTDKFTTKQYPIQSV